jgi:fucose permease
VNTTKQTDVLTVGLAFASFILLGMAAGLLGVAWPSIQTELDLPLDAVGILLLASTSSYLLASFMSGPLAQRVGIGRLFIVAGLLLALGLSGYIFGSSWYMLIGAAFVAGLGSGTIDAALNAYIAAHHSARAMNWLHAFFGIGITIMPLVETEAVKAGTWRNGYAVVVVTALLMTAGFAFLTNRWRVIPTHSTTSKRGVSVRDTLRLPQVWLGILLLAVYAGVEASPGQWVFPLFTETRAMDTNTAGFWVSLYWGSFTVGRMLFGIYMPRISNTVLVRLCIIGAGVGGVMLWWNPITAVGLAGLVMFGFFQAPLFPILISETPKHVGLAHAQNSIGFQVAGAGLGIALLPGLIGVFASRLGLEIVSPALLVLVMLLFILHEVRIAYSAAHPHMRESMSAAD